MLLTAHPPIWLKAAPHHIIHSWWRARLRLALTDELAPRLPVPYEQAVAVIGGNAGEVGAIG